MKKLFIASLCMAGAYGSAAQAYVASDYCREYQRTIYVGGAPQQGYGTACLQPDGSWQIISGEQAGQRIEPQYVILDNRPVVSHSYTTSYRRSYGVPVSYLSVSFGNPHRYHHHPGHYYPGYRSAKFLKSAHRKHGGGRHHRKRH